MGEEGLYIAKKVPVLSTTQRDLLIAVEGMLIFNSTTDQLEEYDGATWQAVGQVILDTHAALTATHGVSGTIADAADLTTHEADFNLHTKTVIKTADETVNDSTSLQNDDELLLAVGASEKWVIAAAIRNSSSAVADFKLKFTIPSGATGWGFLAGESTSQAAYLSIANTAVGWATAGYPTGHFLYIVLHIIVGATAGNVQLQWAQNTQEASDTKVLAGSCLVGTKLA